VKSMPPGRGDVLEAEALGLAALAEPGVIPVPRVLGTGTFPGGRPFLVLDWIDHNPGGKADQRSLGRNLARLHRVTHAHYGWSRNNYIGSSPQINTPVESWVQFFGLHRIGYQYELGKKPVRSLEILLEK
jgi:fructosamine-3-kinase